MENTEKTKSNKIGFEVEGKKYDFFIDIDGNGKLSNIQEFFGAENGWASMAALDLNGDGKITGDEMDAVGLKIVITDETGFQQIINASELFNEENEAIDLTSYNEINLDLNEDVSLIGNFNVILNDFGEDIIEGYNTLESFDFLNENYKFTDYEIQTKEAEEFIKNAEEQYKECIQSDINPDEIQQARTTFENEEQELVQKIDLELNEAVKDVEEALNLTANILDTNPEIDN